MLSGGEASEATGQLVSMVARDASLPFSMTWASLRCAEGHAELA